MSEFFLMKLENKSYKTKIVSWKNFAMKKKKSLHKVINS